MVKRDMNLRPYLRVVSDVGYFATLLNTNDTDRKRENGNMANNLANPQNMVREFHLSHPNQPKQPGVSTRLRPGKR
jgi:hypothetical protein